MMLKLISQNKLLSLLSLAAILIALVSDVFLNKITGSNRASSVLVSLPQDLHTKKESPATPAIQEIEQLFTQQSDDLNTDSTPEDKTAIMSAEQQARQQGILRSFFSNNIEYQLAAVYRRQQNVAVLSTRDLITEVRDSRALQKGDRLGNYQVTDIRPKAVILINGDYQVELRLFLPVNEVTNALSK